MTITMERRIQRGREKGTYEQHRARLTELLEEGCSDSHIAAKMSVSTPTLRVMLATLDLCESHATASRARKPSNARMLRVAMMERREFAELGEQVMAERWLVQVIRENCAQWDRGW